MFSFRNTVYRPYLLLCGFTYSSWGVGFLLAAANPTRWTNASFFRVVGSIIPIFWWGMLTLPVGLAFFWQFYKSPNMIKKTKAMHRLSGIAAAINTFWMIEFLLATISDSQVAPVVPITYFYAACVHMLMTAAPMRELQQGDIARLLAEEKD